MKILVAKNTWWLRQGTATSARLQGHGIERSIAGAWQRVLDCRGTATNARLQGHGNECSIARARHRALDCRGMATSARLQGHGNERSTARHGKERSRACTPGRLRSDARGCVLAPHSLPPYPPHVTGFHVTGFACPCRRPYTHLPRDHTTS
eukprot:356710-Chlamydomonas_euryale.AAC.2